MNNPKKKPDLTLESIITNKRLQVTLALISVISFFEGWIPLTPEERVQVLTFSLIAIGICALVFIIHRDPFKFNFLALRDYLSSLKATKLVVTGLLTLAALSVFIGPIILFSLLYSGDVNPWISSHLERCAYTTNSQSTSSTSSPSYYSTPSIITPKGPLQENDLSAYNSSYDGTPGIITPPGGLPGVPQGGSDLGAYNDVYKGYHCTTVGITPLAGFAAILLRLGYLILCVCIIFLFYIYVINGVSKKLDKDKSRKPNN